MASVPCSRSLGLLNLNFHFVKISLNCKYFYRFSGNRCRSRTICIPWSREECYWCSCYWRTCCNTSSDITYIFYGSSSGNSNTVSYNIPCCVWSAKWSQYVVAYYIFVPKFTPVYTKNYYWIFWLFGNFCLCWETNLILQRQMWKWLLSGKFFSFPRWVSFPAFSSR